MSKDNSPPKRSINVDIREVSEEGVSIKTRRLHNSLKQWLVEG
jgi:hypothetical protein